MIDYDITHNNYDNHIELTHHQLTNPQYMIDISRYLQRTLEGFLSL
jgi:hypothetical protein